jgi:hypothetical protein
MHVVYQGDNIHTAHLIGNTHVAQKEDLHWLRLEIFKYENTDRSGADDTAVPPEFQRTWWWPSRPKYVVQKRILKGINFIS